MRIVHILTRLLRAGSEENTLLTAAGQIAEGHDVHLLHGRDVIAEHALHLAPGAHLAAAPSLVRDLDPTADAAAFGQIRRILRSLCPDVVHTHQSKAGILGRFAAYSARVPLVVHGVHILPFLGVGRMKRTFYLGSELAAARVTHGFIHVSDGMRQACLAHGVGAGRAHHVAFSGFDLARFSNAMPPDDLPALLGERNDAERPVVIAMLAALEPRKRHADLLRHGVDFLRRHPNVRLILAGEGELAGELSRLVAELNLSDRVTFLGYRADPERIIAAADICIHCSEREGLPRSVLQYLAGGRAVVMFDLPGIEEVITDGRNGILVPQGRWPAFFDQLGRLASDPGARAALGMAAARTPLHRWDAARMGARTVAIYHEIRSESSLQPVVS